MQVRVHFHPHVQQHRRRDAHVAVTGNVVQDETRNRRREHQNGRDNESVQISPHQGVIDHVL